jgi:hypothetical protein
MKFDRLIKQILNEGHLGIPAGINYRKRPDEALQKMAEAYDKLIAYNVNSFNSEDNDNRRVAMAGEIGNLLYIITYVISESNLENYQIGGEEIPKVTLIRNVLNKMEQFQPNNKPKYPVPEELQHTVPDAFGNPIRPGMELSAGDHRLYILQNKREIKKYGGFDLWQNVYKKLLPLIHLKHQVYRRREESHMAEEGSQNFVVYYWGQDYMPYRVVLKANKDGKIVTHARHVSGTAGEVNPKKGYAFWRTDHHLGKDKPIPLAFIDQATGSYDSTLITDEQGNPLNVKEIYNLMLRNDFDIIREELVAIRNMSNDERISLNEKQQEMSNAPRDLKVSKYFEFLKPFREALELKGRKRKPLEYVADQEFFFPFFTGFRERNGNIFPMAMNAEMKFKQNWPQELFPELYTER